MFELWPSAPRTEEYLPGTASLVQYTLAVGGGRVVFLCSSLSPCLSVSVLTGGDDARRRPRHVAENAGLNDLAGAAVSGGQGRGVGGGASHAPAHAAAVDAADVVAGGLDALKPVATHGRCSPSWIATCDDGA